MPAAYDSAWGDLALERRFGLEYELAVPGNLGNRRDANDQEMNQTRALVARRLAEVPGQDVRFDGYTHAVTAWWKVVIDATAQVDGYTGFELVSPILGGADGHNKLTAMLEKLATFNPQVSATCGHHVHLNAKAELQGGAPGLEKIKKACWAFIAYEPAFDLLTSKSRQAEQNDYCQSNRENLKRRHGSLANVLARIKAANSARALVQVVNPPNPNPRQDRNGRQIPPQPEMDRYYKLNVTNLVNGRHARTAPQPSGTIEFRQHQGCVYAKKSRMWVELLQRFVHCAMTLDNYMMPPENLPPYLLFAHMCMKMINRHQLTVYWYGRILTLDSGEQGTPRRVVRISTEQRASVRAAEQRNDGSIGKALKDLLYRFAPNERPQPAAVNLD